MTKAIVIMGVSGSGKTSIGQALADELGWPFFDGDDYHPLENVRKMSRGIPLDDQDREPWLLAMRNLLAAQDEAGQALVLACSALKQNYRDGLRAGNEKTIFVLLNGDYDLIWNRMRSRKEHFMKPELLKSQFEVLEFPTDAIIIDISKTIPDILREITEFISPKQNSD